MKLPEEEFGRWQVINFIGVFVFSIWGIINFQAKYTENDKTFFQELIVESVAPLQEGVSSGRSFVEMVIDNYLTIVSSRKENLELQKQIDELEQKLFEMKVIKSENKRLKDLLQFGEEIQYKKILAQVIGWDSSGELYTLRINKGTKSGIKKKMAVINSKGLIGIVTDVTPNYSDIMTVLDFNNKVDVLVERSRTFGILQGFGNRLCRLKYVTNSENIVPGDVLLTSGFGSLYPKGIRVGEVKDVARNEYELTQKIRIKPFVDFNKVEEVVVLAEENIELNEYKQTEN